MREIKFRAWHPKNGMFSPGVMGQDQLTLMPDGRGFVNVSSVDTRLSQFMTHMIPMQYTGLKDTNGVEIYEGDVLRDDGELAIQGAPIGVVYWGRGAWEIDRQAVTDRNMFTESGETNELEIIGNIYENPELIPEVSQ